MIHKKFIHGFLVTVGPSIYTNRTGRTDIRIARETDWGARHENGRLYSTIQVRAAESLDIIRNFGGVDGKTVDAAIEFARSVLLSQTAEQELPCA